MTREWLTILASNSCSSISEKSCSITFKHVWNRNDCLIHNAKTIYISMVEYAVWYAQTIGLNNNNIERRMKILKRECHLLVNPVNSEWYWITPPPHSLESILNRFQIKDQFFSSFSCQEFYKYFINKMNFALSLESNSKMKYFS